MVHHRDSGYSQRLSLCLVVVVSALLSMSAEVCTTAVTMYDQSRVQLQHSYMVIGRGKYYMNTSNTKGETQSNS